MPRLLRIFLLPIALVLELVLLSCGWALALTSPANAARLAGLAKSLPGLEWYVGKSAAQTLER